MGLGGREVVALNFEKAAFVFPGQGSQSVGMGKGFYENFAGARKVFDEANEALGFDIRGLSFNGPKEELDRTEFTQPALLAASMAALAALRETSAVEPDYVAGHSLGEYSAIAASGGLGLRDAVRLVHLRGRFMQEAVPQGRGSMCAIIGLGQDAVREACIRASSDGEVVVPANINSPEQIVISGHAGAVEKAAAIARGMGAKRAITLQVSAPSHSPLMAPAADRLKAELEKLGFSGLKIPLVTNAGAEPVIGAAEVKDSLVRQLTSPVRWVDVVRRMRLGGVGLIVEIGPGKALAGLVKRIEKDMNILNLGEPSDIEAVASALNRP